MKALFHKYQAAGSDFIVAHAEAAALFPDPGLVRRLCDRRLGIGAMGLVTVDADPDGGLRIAAFDPQGEEVPPSGDALWCALLFARHAGIGAEEFSFTAGGAPHTAFVTVLPSGSGTVRLTLGARPRHTLEGDRITVATIPPHTFRFVNGAHGGPDDAGRLRIEPDGSLHFRPHGAGEVPAAASGALAAALALRLLCLPEQRACTVQLPEGRVEILFDPSGDTASVTGPARKVMECIVEF